MPSKEIRNVNLVTGASKFAPTTTERGKGLNPGQMGVWVVGRKGLPWETCLPSLQALTALKPQVLLLQPQVLWEGSGSKPASQVAKATIEFPHPTPLSPEFKAAGSAAPPEGSQGLGQRGLIGILPAVFLPPTP